LRSTTAYLEYNGFVSISRIYGSQKDQETANGKDHGMAVLSVECAKDRLVVIHHLEIDIGKLIRMRNSDLPLRVCVILWADR
jgi:hypothetical protein